MLRLHPQHLLRCSLASTAQRGRCAGNLALLAGRRCPRQSQWITDVARDDVDVEVKDDLPGGSTRRMEQVDTVSPETLARTTGNLLGQERARDEVWLGDSVNVGDVRPRDNERMSARRRIDIGEGKRTLGLGHDVAGELAGEDLAEHTIVR
jgi:hypothetical protein